MDEREDVKEKKRFIRVFHNPVVAWVILFVSLTLTISAYFISSSMVDSRLREKFEFRAHEISQAIADRLAIYETVLWSGVAFLYAAEEVNRSEFRKFVETLDLKKNWPGIQGIGYSVLLKSGEKENLIAKIRSDGFPDFDIYPEGTGDIHSSIIFLEPFDWRNKRAFGYDMWTNPVRREAMKRATESGKAATSGIITLVQETKTDVQKGFLTYIPVYEGGMIPETIAEKAEKLRGWIYAPFRGNDLMAGILGLQDQYISFEIFDGNQRREESLLFDSNSIYHLDSSEPDQRFQKNITLNLQGRPWLIHFTLPKPAVISEYNALPVSIAVAGGVVDMLLFYVIFSLCFLNRRTENIVNHRTRQLHQAKGELEIKVRQRTRDLQIKVEEMEQFSHIAAHDLKSPLSTISMYISRFNKGDGKKLSDEGRLCIDRIQVATNRLLALISGLMDFSRSSSRRLQLGSLDMQEMVTEVVASLDSEIKSCQANIVVSSLPVLPCASPMLNQVFQNLIGNAMRYRHKDRQPEITISCTEEDDHFIFSVRDNGIGIRDDHYHKIFEVFQRLHTDKDYPGGTGIGLSVCKKIVERHGGHIWVSSKEGQETIFSFSVPKSGHDFLRTEEPPPMKKTA